MTSKGYFFGTKDARDGQISIRRLHSDECGHTVLYTGVTNDLQRRMEEHKGSRFTGQYKATRLVYYETGDDIRQAIFRDKQMKAGSRQDKLDLIHSLNPEWRDLSIELFGKTT